MSDSEWFRWRMATAWYLLGVLSVLLPVVL